MESPVVLDKPPEYGNGNERGFPFEEDEAGAGAWRDLAARHPDIAARLRARPQTWARKRRPSNQQQEDFGDDFSGFDRFPFDDIPPEFRGHFPNWNRRYEEQPSASQPQQTPQPQQPPPPQPTHVTTSTQTETPPEATQEAPIPQYGLRNTVDLGQGNPSVVDEDRAQRSMSAPPETREQKETASKMSGQTPPHGDSGAEQHSNVRHIPIFVEGRDEPVINKRDFVDGHAAPEPQPHREPPREQFFPEEPVNFHHPPNFGRAFGAPFNKGFRQGPQPFSQQKVFPQAAFGRASSPQRSASPRQHEEFVKVPVHHEPPRNEPPRAQQRPQPPPQQKPQPQPQPQQPQAPPPPKPQPTPNDPITQILAIQTDVLNLMTDVENFGGAKNDKQYMYLDEMLTRNLIKLDNIETDGKENIRQARKEAIRCIQKCIAVLEAKAEKNAQAAAAAAAPEAAAASPAPPADAEMAQAEQNSQNGEVEMKENTKEAEEKVQSLNAEPQAADTRPEEPRPEPPPPAEEKKSPKKKVIKKRDKSKDKKEEKNQEAMQVDDKGEKDSQNTQAMEVDPAAASQ